MTPAWANSLMFPGVAPSPIAMAILFLGVVVPVGLVARIFRRDPLNQRPDRDKESYGIERSDEQSFPAPSMRKQG